MSAARYTSKLVPMQFRRQLFSVFCNLRSLEDSCGDRLPPDARQQNMSDWLWVAHRVLESFQKDARAQEKQRLVALAFKKDKPSPIHISMEMNISPATYHNWMDEIYTTAYIAAIERGMLSHFNLPAGRLAERRY